MRNYQSQKKNPYLLPHNLYMRMLYLVRDYERVKKLGTEQAAREYQAVERALQTVPEEYRDNIFANLLKSEPYPLDASAETYSRWRRRFLYFIAAYLELI